jgi:outer membrane protein assembly factor BamB
VPQRHHGDRFIAPFALDARNGELLWKVNLGGNVASGPMTFAVDRRQYVAVSGEGALYVFALSE